MKIAGFRRSCELWTRAMEQYIASSHI